MKFITVPLFLGLFYTAQSMGAWLSDTPLKHTYEALLSHNPELAWQELQLALMESEVPVKYWVEAKQVILEQTACGRELPAMADALPANLTLSVMQRIGLVNSGYQLKLSGETIGQPLPFELLDQNGKSILSGTFKPQEGHQEFETAELMSPPPPGLYSLKLGNEPYPVLVSPFSGEQWVKLYPVAATPSVKVFFPPRPSACQGAQATWQWFDAEYELVAPSVAINGKVQSGHTDLAEAKRRESSGEVIIAPFPEYVPAKANRLSAVVAVDEFQAGVRVRYSQRLSLPFMAGN